MSTRLTIAVVLLALLALAPQLWRFCVETLPALARSVAGGWPW
jgi:hypothetical protein